MNGDLKYQLQRAYSGWALASFCYDNNLQLEYIIPKDNEVKLDDSFLETLRGNYIKIRSPYIAMEKSGTYFIGFTFDDDKLLVLGPAAIGMLSFEQNIDFRISYGIKNKDYKVPVLSITAALNLVTILYDTATGVKLTDGDIFRANNLVKAMKDEDIIKYEYSRELDEKHRLSYAYEQKWLSDIENGIFDKRSRELSPENIDIMSQVGLLAEDNFKQTEYMVVAAITLVSRAAIRAGVSTFEAYSVSDLYFQKVSKAKDIMELLHIYMQLAEDYSGRVKIAKENRAADYIERVLDYVARHRTHKISVTDIAKEVGLSTGYLSRKFTEEMGITLQEYILKQRLMAGANMLEFSDLTVGEISEYLSFSSQSYFGDRFKEEYGITPQQYRRVHKIIDFQ